MCENWLEAIANQLRDTLATILGERAKVRAYPPVTEPTVQKQASWHLAVWVNDMPLCYVFLYAQSVELERHIIDVLDNVYFTELEYADPALIDRILEWVSATVNAVL